MRTIGEVMNLDALKISRLGCILDTNFYTKLLVGTLLPMGLTGVIFTIGAVLFMRGRSESSKAAVIDGTVSIFLTLTYMVFASVSTTIFDTFNCQAYGDDSTEYLSSDQVRTWTGWGRGGGGGGQPNLTHYNSRASQTNAGRAGTPFTNCTQSS
jgi:hypothetical protein